MLQKVVGAIRDMVKPAAAVARRKYESSKPIPCGLVREKRRQFSICVPCRALALLWLFLATPTWAIDPAAVAILKDQTKGFLAQSVANSLDRRAAKIGMAYSQEFMSIFGTANSIKNEDLRKRIQSWASKQSMYYSQQGYRLNNGISTTKVSMATKLAVANGLAPILEQVWVAHELADDIEDLRKNEPQFSSLIPASAWEDFMTKAALATMEAGMQASIQAAATYALSRSLSISLKAAGYPITITWAIFGNPQIAGSPEEMWMPASSDSEALVNWATTMSKLAAEVETGCAGNRLCLEAYGSLPGTWSFFKLKYEYFNALESPFAARYSWVTRYEVCADSNMGVCPVTPGTSPISDSASPFRDVKPDHWASCYIKKLSKIGIVNGNNGLFHPDNEVSRAEFLKMVLNAAYSPSQFASTSINSFPVTYFKDSDFAAWQNAYVNFAIQMNIVSGNYCPGSLTDRCFYPNASITRSEAVAILVRSFGLQQNGPQNISFPDTQVSKYPSVYVAASNYGKSGCGGANERIISGFKDGNFYPNTHITRDQAAKIVAIALSLKKP